MTAIVTRGDAAKLHLPDESVDLIVTSPPYHQLRAYQDGGVAYEEQIGAEPTPGEYLDALVSCTHEWMRTLKPSGSLFVNLGDAYHDKGLRGLPWRYALRCIDDLGLILRAEIVWAKPNGLPESVTDRVRRSHEQVFHFVKHPRYYSAVDEVREPLIHPGRGITPEVRRTEERIGHRASRGACEADRVAGDTGKAGHPLGKLPGSVWEIPTSPLKVPEHLGVDHFAAYPPELVRRIVLGWSPREVCTACGEGRRPVAEQVDARYAAARALVKPTTARDIALNSGGRSNSVRSSDINNGVVRPDYRITGYACACPDTTAPITPGVVLDPFGGTGTTALVASCYGRVGISVDLSVDYCRLACWRTSDSGERARVLGVAKPRQQVDGQLGMFEGMGA